MNELQIFNNQEFGSIRTLEQDGKILFCGTDVARALGYAIPTKAVNTHCKGVSKMEAPTNGGVQKLLFIPEGDVYRLITHSKLPTAEQFEKWVFDEVLPGIRKNGGYISGQETLSDSELMARALMVAQKTLEEREKRLATVTAENQLMKPKADYFDALVDRNLLTSIRETAKELGVKERVFVKTLLDKKYLYRAKRGKLLPYADKNKGLFEVKECISEKAQWSGTQTLITPKGRETLRLLFIKH